MFKKTLFTIILGTLVIASAHAGLPGDISDLTLEKTFVDRLTELYARFYSKNLDYHQNLYNLVVQQRDEKGIRYDHVEAVVRNSYFQARKFEKDAIEGHAKSGKWPEAKDEPGYLENLRPINEAIEVCLSECNGLTLNQGIQLLGDLIVSYRNSRSISRYSNAYELFTERSKKSNWTDENYAQYTEVLYRKQAYGSIVNLLKKRFLKEFPRPIYANAARFVDSSMVKIRELIYAPGILREQLWSELISSLPSISYEELTSLVGALSAEDSLEKKDYEVSYSNVVTKGSQKLLAPVTMEQVRGLVKIGLRSGFVSLAKKIPSLSLRDTLELAGFSSYDEKDQIVAYFLFTNKEPQSVQSIGALSDACYQNKQNTILALAPSSSDLNMTNAKALSDRLSYDSKDSFVKVLLERFTEISTSDLILAQSFAYQNKASTILSNLQKVKDMSAANLALLANCLSYDSKDELVRWFMTNTRTMSYKDLAAVANLAYQNKESTILDGAAKIKEFSIDALLALLKNLSYDNKDLMIGKYIARKDSFELNELISISQAAYQNKQSILLDNLLKIRGLNANGMKTICDNLSYDNKDRGLLVYLKSVSAISFSDLLVLSESAYQEKSDILITYLSLVSNLKAAELLAAAEKVSYDNKDAILLKYLGKLVDLSAKNLLDLSNAGYQQKQEIMKKGLEILGK